MFYFDACIIIKYNAGKIIMNLKHIRFYIAICLVLGDKMFVTAVVL